MGKGDKKTKRGKIIKGSFGRLRPKKRSSKLIDTGAREQNREAKQEVKETRVRQPVRDKTKASKETKVKKEDKS